MSQPESTERCPRCAEAETLKRISDSQAHEAWIERDGALARLAEAEKERDRLKRIVDNHNVQCVDWVGQRNSAWRRLVEIGKAKRAAEERVAQAERALFAARQALIKEGMERDAAEAGKDGAYAERNEVVALLARMALALGWRVGIAQHEDRPGESWDPDWRTIVFIDLPTGQVSWHFHDGEWRLVEGLPPYAARWDGHDTTEKYKRVCAALDVSRAEPRAAAPKALSISGGGAQGEEK